MEIGPFLYAQTIDPDDSPNPFEEVILDPFEEEEMEDDPFFREPSEHTFFFDYLALDRHIHEHFIKSERDRSIMDESYHRSVTGVQLSSDVEEQFYEASGPLLVEFYKQFEPYNRGSIISTGLEHALQIGGNAMEVQFLLVDDREGVEADSLQLLSFMAVGNQ